MKENDQIEQELPPAQRHIIKRPRLTKLLDETEARIILLVAPAGYGKTTLAREWLSSPERSVVWFQARAANRDVASLAKDVASAVAAIRPDAIPHISQRLSITSSPDTEPVALAEVLAQDVSDWPTNTWLVIDDYNVFAGAEPAETFVQSLSELSGVRILVASRERPAWVSARQLLYGECLELGPTDLAMTYEEARETLMDQSPSRLTGVISLAGGWPAIIGLAAFAGRAIEPAAGLPVAVHDFLAEELFQTIPLASRRGLCLLSLAPKLTRALVQDLLGPAAENTLEDGFRCGFLTTDAEGESAMHPLLRSFLIRKSGEVLLQSDTCDAAKHLALYFLQSREWDEAFAVIREHGLPDLLPRLFSEALREMIQEGRLSTLGRWIEYSREAEVDTPITNLAAAEVALRQGDYMLAESLALAAARGFGGDAPWAARAYGCAGRSAHLFDASERALAHHTQALELSTEPRERRQALWGQLIAALNVPDTDARGIVDAFTAAAGDAPDDVLRLAQARLILASTTGPLEEAVSAALGAARVLQHARDPLVRSGFLNNLTDALTLTGRYQEALRFGEDEIEESERFRLRFVHPHACLNLANAYIGLGEYTRAHTCLTDAQRDAEDNPDPHLHVHLLIVRIRLATAQGDAKRIVKTSWAELHAGLDDLPRPALVSELFATQAFASACAGNLQAADELATRAQSFQTHIDTTVLLAATSAVAELQTDRYRGSGVSGLIKAVGVTGNIHGAIYAIRSYPSLLLALGETESGRALLQLAVRRTGDRELAARAGVVLPPKRRRLAAQLSRREEEIIFLVAEGLRNRDIAERLFISEKTVKTHLQHIYEKLDAHNRVEAVRRAGLPTPKR
jgi:LuxR family maltose regulon positive regulatory protein